VRRFAPRLHVGVYGIKAAWRVDHRRRVPDNDTVFARCSTTGGITTLWSGPILPFGIAVDETSLYFATSERSDDGGPAHGAILALPAQR